MVLAFCVAYWGKASSHPAAQAVISCWFRAAAQAGSAVAQVNQQVLFFFIILSKGFGFMGANLDRAALHDKRKWRILGKVRLEPPYRLL